MTKRMKVWVGLKDGKVNFWYVTEGINTNPRPEVFETKREARKIYLEKNIRKATLSWEE